MKFDKLMELRRDDLVYRTITAFEAPSTVVMSDFEGAFVTPQTFPVYTLDRSRLLPLYMGLLTTSPVFHEEMASRCVGTVLRRKTLSKSAFESIPLTLPCLSDQHRMVDLITAIDDAVKAAEVEADAAFALLESARDLLIWGHHPSLSSLSTKASIAGKLVNPTDGEYCELPHIGTERIRSGTGDLVGVVTAKEDAVTSGKFLHEAGTVVYSKIRPNLRKVAVPDWRGLCSADAYPMLPIGDGNVSFLRHLLLTRHFTDQAVARSGRTKMPKVNRAELMSIQVPDIASQEQDSIARTLDAIDLDRVATSAAASALRTLRSNLLTVLLSGEHEIPASYDKFRNLNEEAAT
ncbi:hypothetical protein [Labedella endophytica]|uniref:Type I restriction modification DNA specificity domain-containing protein n=1 Tax=Labedella endophytica TaxID=1523160 RepID=A0A3S0XXK2_9MICO|nr:hypothetical protein [Labedella endophytica]RUQ98188.1 hypothetical protein ELQ94_14300 [Labedella endophytica]